MFSNTWKLFLPKTEYDLLNDEIFFFSTAVSKKFPKTLCFFKSTSTKLNSILITAKKNGLWPTIEIALFMKV